MFRYEKLDKQYLIVESIDYDDIDFDPDFISFSERSKNEINVSFNCELIFMILLL